MFLGHPIYEELKNLIGEEATRKIAELWQSASLFTQAKENTSCSCADCLLQGTLRHFRKEWTRLLGQ
jgi:hypothetical protein